MKTLRIAVEMIVWLLVIAVASWVIGSSLTHALLSLLASKGA